MDKRSKKRRRKQAATENAFDLELARLAAQHGLDIPDKEDEGSATSSSSSSSSSDSSDSDDGINEAEESEPESESESESETYISTEDVDHEALARATQFIASSNWVVRTKTKFDAGMLSQPLRWRPPLSSSNDSHRRRRERGDGDRSGDGDRGERTIDERELIATCMQQARDARESIFAIRSPTWCSSCLDGISNTLLSLESFGNPLLAQNEDVVVNLRRLLSSLHHGGGNMIDPVTHVRVLCDLDDLYHRCYYHMASRKDGAKENWKSRAKYPTPNEYLETTCPSATYVNKVIEKFRNEESMGGENGAVLWDKMMKIHDGGLVVAPSSGGKTAETFSNPLLTSLNLRWRETICLFHYTRTAKDGRMDAVASTVASSSSLSSSSSSSSTTTSSSSTTSSTTTSSSTAAKRKKKRKKSTGTTMASMSETNGNRIEL